MVQTKMATSTEAEGDIAVEVPSEMEEELVDSPTPEDSDENDIPSEDMDDEVEEESGPQESEESEPEPSPREEKRVKKLIPKLKEESAKRRKAEQEASALRELLQKSKPGQNESIYGLNNLPPWATQGQNPILQPNENGEVTAEQLQQAIAQTADELTSMKLAQFQHNIQRYDTLKEDAEYLQETYTPSKEDEETIAALYEVAAQNNPNLRLKDFAEPIFKRIQAGQEIGKQAVTPKLIRQEAEGAVPPGASGYKKGSSNPDDMSLEEMEEYLRANDLWDEA